MSLAPSPALAAAQTAYDQGRYQAALETARSMVGSDLAAWRLRALAAFRVGELDECAEAARSYLDDARSAADALGRLDVLGVSVVAAGELGRYEQSIEHLQLMQAAAARSGSLQDFVRGRGTTATAFALIGDPWAAQRLLAELIGLFQGPVAEPRLEATARNNHASVCLQIARIARHGRDHSACEEALDHALASMARTREIARERRDPRVAAFVDVHQAEVHLLRGEPGPALALLDGALARAETAGLAAHARQLRLLEAEGRLVAADTEGAAALLATLGERLGAGHELQVRIRFHDALHRLALLRKDLPTALAEQSRAHELAQTRQYLQAQAQSRFLRARLELEHLYRFRPGTRQAPLPPAQPAGADNSGG